MSHLHWMKLYLGDELAMASHMTNAEFGSYMFLKMHYWQFGHLPIDDRRLARIARVRDEDWPEMKATIEVLFDDEWGSKRMDEQRAEAEERHTRRVEAGRKGGRPPKEEKQSFPTKKAMLKQPEPEPALASSSALAAAPHSGALDKEGGESSMYDPFPSPADISEARKFLVARDVPEIEMDKMLRMLMGGHLTPFDIEQYQDTEN